MQAPPARSAGIGTALDRLHDFLTDSLLHRFDLAVRVTLRLQPEAGAVLVAGARIVVVGPRRSPAEIAAIAARLPGGPPGAVPQRGLAGEPDLNLADGTSAVDLTPGDYAGWRADLLSRADGPGWERALVPPARRARTGPPRGSLTVGLGRPRC